VPTEGRFSALSLARHLSPRWTRRLLGLVGTLSVMLLLTVGCGASGESRPLTGGDQSKETEACPVDQRPAASQKSKTEQSSTKDCVAQNRPQGSEPATRVRSTPNPQGAGPKSILGVNAEATLSILQKPGLECWQPADREVLYSCSGDENPDLLYEARIRGSSADEVSGIEARVVWRGTGHFEQASRPFFGLLSAQLHYRGSNSTRAFEFVNRNVSSRMATTTIGAAKWTMTTSDDSKELTLTPAY
jgi:hypothetical protein